MDIYEREIRLRISRGQTHQEISDFLVSVLPSHRGLSPRSVRRFCAQRGIHYRSCLNNTQLDRLISSTVRRVGHSYGRRSIQGLLRSHGVNVSQRRIGSSLRRSFPMAHAQRTANVVHHLNPVPYRASFFGEKLHLDQNEKLCMYGIVHILAVDGYSRKIVGFITIPKKNPIAIYRYLFHPLLRIHGIWQQIRMDHGTEFALVSTVQQYIAHLRTSSDRYPVLRSLSRHNHRAERLWPEINAKINYPFKRVLVRMEEMQQIDMEDGVTKFSVSWVTTNVIVVPIKEFIRAWNAHTIPGLNGGVPNDLERTTNRVTSLASVDIPSVDSAINTHLSQGGYLSPECTMVYGTDPIANYPMLQKLREHDFTSLYPSYELLFEDILHNNGSLFQQAILSFIEINKRYSALVS